MLTCPRTCSRTPSTAPRRCVAARMAPRARRRAPARHASASGAPGRLRPGRPRPCAHPSPRGGRHEWIRCCARGVATRVERGAGARCEGAAARLTGPSGLPALKDAVCWGTPEARRREHASLEGDRGAEGARYGAARRSVAARRLTAREARVATRGGARASLRGGIGARARDISARLVGDQRDGRSQGRWKRWEHVNQRARHCAYRPPPSRRPPALSPAAIRNQSLGQHAAQALARGGLGADERVRLSPNAVGSREVQHREGHRGVHQEGVRQEVQPDLALHCGAQLRLVRDPRDEALHLFLPRAGELCDGGWWRCSARCRSRSGSAARMAGGAARHSLAWPKQRWLPKEDARAHVSSLLTHLLSFPPQVAILLFKSG